MKKVVHATSVHRRDDVRIYMKECLSLAKGGYQVYLVVADGEGDASHSGVTFLDVGKPVDRLNRIFKSAYRVFKKATKINADIYHFHDPELMFFALCMKLMGKKVIFDAHEDLPKQILSKPYLGKTSKIFFYVFATLIERLICWKFDAIVSATQCISKKFHRINNNVVVINNYPLLSEISENIEESKNAGIGFFYCGAISRIRGAIEMADAVSNEERPHVLSIAGTFNEKALYDEMKISHSWRNVNYYGQLPRSEVKAISRKSIAGLVLFYPSPNHVDSQPNKLFEYMASGLPVICSNFTMWKGVIEKYQCGICVDPTDIIKIRSAMDYMSNDLEEAKKMGANGLKAVKEIFNWTQEEKKLLELYRSI